MSFFENINTVSVLTSGNVNILNNPLPVNLPDYQTDAFGRLRVSNPVSLFVSKQCVTNDSEIWDAQSLSGTSTFSATNASTLMQVSGTSGAYNIRQSFQRMNYVPAKSQLVDITTHGFAPQSGCTKHFGYYNNSFTAPFSGSSDGLFWESKASGPSGISVNIGNLGVIETAVQSAWNVDKFDGLGPSGKIVTDWNKNQIYFTQFQWLGVGTVAFGLVIDGIPYVCHEFEHANSTTGVYMSSPNHSIRYSLRSTGGSGSMTQICSAVQSEGGFDPHSVERSVNNGKTTVAGPNKDLDWAMLGVRINPLITNAAGINIQTESLDVMTTTANANGQFAKVLNPNISGTVTWLDFPNASGLQYFVGGSTNLTSGGIEYHRGYYSAALNQTSNKEQVYQRIGVGISGNSQTLVLVGNNTVNNAAMFCAMNMQVIY